MPSKLCKILIFEFLRGPQIQSFFFKNKFLCHTKLLSTSQTIYCKNFRFKQRVREQVRWLTREREYVCVCERERERERERYEKILFCSRKMSFPMMKKSEVEYPRSLGRFDKFTKAVKKSD